MGNTCCPTRFYTPAGVPGRANQNTLGQPEFRAYSKGLRKVSGNVTSQGQMIPAMYTYSVSR